MNSRWACVPGIILLTASALFLWGCADGGGTEVGNPASTSDERLAAYLKEQHATNLLPDWVAESALGVPTSGTGGTGGAPQGETRGDAGNFSQTNVQEEGVDESDTVKTDGIHLFVARSGSVDVARSDAGGGLELLSRIALNGAVDSLYLQQGILAVLFTPAGAAGGPWGGREPSAPTIEIGLPYWLPVAAKTGLLLVDVRDPSSPARIREWTFDGNLVSSRVVGTKLHLVTQFFPELPLIETHYGTTPGRDETIRTNRERLRSMTLDDLVPSYTAFDGSGRTLAQGRLVATEDFVLPEDPEGGTIVAVVTIDLQNPGSQHSVGAVLDAHHVYASTRTLYLASQRFRADPSSAIRPSGDFLLSIHAFDLTGGEVSYTGKGEVPGTALNQFSFGEHEGVLRVATTTGFSWDGTSRNHVHCLKAGGTLTLETIGKLENLAPGESIYSARFVGPRGFLVTFVKVDPLLTLDLSDPTAPRLVGELKVPGYSEYIHPLDENHILAIGKNATVEGDIAWYQGVQLSVFDVTDFANPVLLHSHVLGDRGTDSEALRTHKAFTYWTGRGLLAIPVAVYEHLTPSAGPWEWGTHTFTGLQVFRVAIDQGFATLGRIPAPDAPWTRGLFIGDSVLAVTPKAIRSGRLEDIERTIKTLEFPE